MNESARSVRAGPRSRCRRETRITSTAQTYSHRRRWAAWRMPSLTFVRDKALVWTLYESATRVGEARRCGSETRSAPSTEESLSSSSRERRGCRTVRPYEAAVPNLLMWLKNHLRGDVGVRPARNRAEKPNPNRGPTSRDRPILTTFDTPAHLRSHRIGRSSTSGVDEFFGWEARSRMAKTCVHLPGTGIENALARAHGVEVGKSQTLGRRLPRTGGRCSTSNGPDANSAFRARDRCRSQGPRGPPADSWGRARWRTYSRIRRGRSPRCSRAGSREGSAALTHHRSPAMGVGEGSSGPRLRSIPEGSEDSDPWRKSERTGEKVVVEVVDDASLSVGAPTKRAGGTAGCRKCPYVWVRRPGSLAKATCPNCSATFRTAKRGKRRQA